MNDGRDYRSAFGIYFLLLVVLFFPYWGIGEVIAPHRQEIEIAAHGISGSERTENRKFNDFSNGYIPEITEHLHGSRSGWLTLWTDHNELGRPVYHVSGFSPAYPPSWIIGTLTDSPWRFITALSVLTYFGAGIFAILYCREIGLAPLAGLIAGSSLAASPLFMYWLTFPMFPAVWCWSAGALWAMSRLARRPDLAGWGALAFSGYSLMMTAYPQPVVYHAYLLGGYGLYLAYRKRRRGPAEIVRFAGLGASALLVAGMLALPVYLDLAFIAAGSARVAPDPSFFTAILPTIDSGSSALRFVLLSTVPELFGNPIRESFPYRYDGLSITPLVMFLGVVGLVTAFRRTWGWWLAIAVFFLLTFVHPLYVLGVEYMGLGLSRSIPFGSITLPLTVVVAHGVDALIRRDDPETVSRAAKYAASSVFAVIAIGAGLGIAGFVPVRWGMVLAMLVVAGLLAANFKTTRPALLVAALLTVLVSISHPLMLRQDPARIATTSPLVEKIRASLPAGSRFAVAAPEIPVLPPNLNASLGLASVHSYNSLSSRRYHTLIEALGGEVRTYGHWNGAISPDYDDAMFWMSNIGLMLSGSRLSDGNLEDLGEESGIHLYRVGSRMGDGLQVFRGSGTGGERLRIADPRLLPNQRPGKVLDEGDVPEFEVAPAASSVLILSQKFHRDWQARALTPQGWIPARTTEINGVFQGVLVPDDARRVRLEFRPFARHAWVAHVFWLMLLAFMVFNARQRRRHAGGEGVWQE